MVTLPVISKFGLEVLMGCEFLEGNSCNSNSESLMFSIVLQSKSKLGLILQGVLWLAGD